MRSWKFVAPIAVCAGFCLSVGSSQAGGLYLPIFGTPSMGSASAGANAIADDASTAIHTPAGMTRLEDHQLLAGLAPGVGVVKFKADAATPSGGDNGGNQGGFLPISSNNDVHRISDRWRFGLGLQSFSGASLDPSDDWAGRNEITKLSLFTLTLLPTLAVRVTDWLSLGGGAAVTYGKLDYNLRVDPLPPLLGEPTIKLKNLDDWAATPIASVLLELTPGLRLGVLYQGETEFHLEGKIKIPPGPTPDINLDLPLAQAVRTSVYWDATDRLALLMSGGWEDWSVAKDLPVSVGAVSAAVPLGFRDTWYLAGGLRFRLSDDWTLQTGLRYDSSALKDSQRTTAFPIDRTYTLGVGGLYDWSENLRLGFSFNWVDLGKAPVNDAFVKGKYRDNDLYMFGVSLQWKKLPWSGKATL